LKLVGSHSQYRRSEEKKTFAPAGNGTLMSRLLALRAIRFMMFGNRVWGVTGGPEREQGARDGENGISHQI